MDRNHSHRRIDGSPATVAPEAVGSRWRPGAICARFPAAARCLLPGAIAAFAALLAAPLLAADPAGPAPQPGQSIVQKTTPAASPADKLDAQIALALKQSRGEPPFDKATAVQPDIPIKEGSRVLVDLTASVTDDLLAHIGAIGGRLAPSPDPAHVVRAMIPLAALEALAGRADIAFIAPTRLEVISRIEHAPGSPGGVSVTKP